MDRPYAPACEQNRDPILAVLVHAFAAPGRVLELGSGTGQHAVYFAARLPHLARWQTSDVPAALPGIRLWLDEARLPNLPPPLALDVCAEPWPIEDGGYDYAFSANTAHILPWPAVEAMFRGVGHALRPGGVFALYGPFAYGGRHTAASNARFDAWLRARSPTMGVRDVDALVRAARAAGLELAEDVAMPADNRTLIWRRP